MLALAIASLGTGLVSREDLRSAIEEVTAPLSKKIAELEELNVALQARIDALGRDVSAANGGESRSGGTTVMAVGANAGAASLRTGTDGRRLTSAGASFVALNQAKYVLHEFPASHTCPNFGSSTTYKAVLPLDASGAATWDPAATVAVANVTLASVANDWSTTDIHQFPAPFKLVHDTTCASAPSLELQLATSTSETFTVGSLDVGASILALQILNSVAGICQIHVSSAVSTGSTMLSANNAGNLAIYSHDEGNQRQRWSIRPLEVYQGEQIYTIRILVGILVSKFLWTVVSLALPCFLFPLVAAPCRSPRVRWTASPCA